MKGDPILNAAGGAIDKHEDNKNDGGAADARKGRVHSTILATLPFFFYITQLMTVVHYYHDSIMLTLVIFAVCVIASIMFSLMAQKQRWLFWLGLLCSVGTWSGQVVGQYIYYNNMIFYFSYHGMRKYTNVRASQNSLQFSDAGMIMWTSDTRVDVSRAVGYSDAASATTVCVAPIVDSSMGQTEGVSFWAVGHNCCESRAHFECDGVGDGAARSGLMLLEPEVLVSPGMRWLLPSEGLGGYMEAIRLERGTFGTTLADNIRFVRWTHDPIFLADDYWRRGIKVVIYSCLVYIFLNTLVGVGVGSYSSSPKKAKREI